MVDVADRAGVLEGSAADWAWLWFVVPVLCGAVLVALALDRRLAVGILAGTLGILTVIGGVMIARSPLVTQVGAWAGIASGGVTALVSTATLNPWSRRRADD